MSRFDKLFQKGAKLAVKLFTASASHILVRKGKYNETTGVEASSTSYYLRGAVTEYSKADLDSGINQAPPTILLGDLRMIVAFGDLPLGVSDFDDERDVIRIDGAATEYRIINVKRLRGADQIAAFELQLRG